MKGLIILAVVAAASAAPSCDDCKAAVGEFCRLFITDIFHKNNAPIKCGNSAEIFLGLASSGHVEAGII